VRYPGERGNEGGGSCECCKKKIGVSLDGGEEERRERIRGRREEGTQTYEIIGESKNSDKSIETIDPVHARNRQTVLSKRKEDGEERTSNQVRESKLREWDLDDRRLILLLQQSTEESVLEGEGLARHVVVDAVFEKRVSKSRTKGEEETLTHSISTRKRSAGSGIMVWKQKA
jgi:hypothetical protein